MKIVHLLHGRPNPNGTNGGDRVIYNVAKCTAELGAQVFVFGITEKPPLPIGRAVVRSFCPARNPLSFPPGLKDTLRRITPDVVHIHGVYTPRYATLAHWFRHQRIPYVISPHGGLMEEVLLRGRIKKATYVALLVRTLCRGASSIHCISEAEANAVRLISGNVPFVVAPHGLEGTNLESLDANALRKQYPKLQGKKIFGFLGRLDPDHKGLDLVVEACAQIRSSLSNAVIVLAGPDWRERTQALRRRVDELALQDTVCFVGPKLGKEKFDFLASCDVFIHPSRWEAGLPFSILDALELARPCLISNGRFFGDFFLRYAAGVQVPLTREGVAEGLQYFAKASAQQLQQMGANGRRAVLQEFSWECTAQKLLRAYDARWRFLSQPEEHSDAPAVA